MADGPQGNGAPEAPQGKGNAPTNAIPEDLNAAMNAAVTGRFRKLEATLDKKLSSLGDSLLEKLAAASTEPKPPEEPTPDLSSLPDDPVSKLTAKHQRELNAMRAEMERFKQDKILTEKRAQDATLRTMVSSELAKIGISHHHQELALGHLVDSARAVSLSDDGRAYYTDPETGIEMPLSAGLADWAKTPSGSVFMPPRSAHGSGDGPNNSTKRSADPKEAAFNVLAQALAAS